MKFRLKNFNGIQINLSRHEAAEECPWKVFTQSSNISTEPSPFSFRTALHDAALLKRKHYTRSRNDLWKLGQHEKKRFETILPRQRFGGFSINSPLLAFILRCVSKATTATVFISRLFALSLVQFFVWSVFFILLSFWTVKQHRSTTERRNEEGQKCVTFGYFLIIFLCLPTLSMPSGSKEIDSRLNRDELQPWNSFSTAL